MQTFQVLINDRFTGNTTPSSSGISLMDDYYLYVNKNGGGIVNPYNVRAYLNDSKNEQIVVDFFVYLTGSTSQPQALNILSSDEKLATIFNDYYQRVVLSGSSLVNTALIAQNLTGASQILSYAFNHPWIGYAPSKQLTGITKDIYGSVNSVQPRLIWQEFTTDESYYLPVYIQRSNNQLARYTYDLCDTNINLANAGMFPQFSAYTAEMIQKRNEYEFNVFLYNFFITLAYAFAGQNPPPGSLLTLTSQTKFDTIIDCFVDLNLNTNENEVEEIVKKVSFQSPNYAFNEGSALQVRIGLDSPSPSGLEEATVNMTPTSAVLNQDFFADRTYPYTFTWAAGEQYKYINFTASTDYFIESPEFFNLQLSNLVNSTSGNNMSASVSISDTTILRTVSLSVAPPAVATQIGQNQSVLLNEGNFVDITINLDGPAFGVESISLAFVNSASTSSVVVGPFPNPASVGSDFTVTSNVVTFNFAPGETQKTYRVNASTDVFIENTETAIFELQNPQFCLINNSKKIMTVSIVDTTGNYKYVHLNLGDIYSEFGDNGGTNTLMRQINPQPGIGGGYNNMYINNYSHNLIKYGNTVNFADYTRSYSIFTLPYDSISFASPYVTAKLTNLGTVQALVNGQYVNIGQTISITVPSNNFIITASTNANKNNITTFFDFANYKVELENIYSGTNVVTGMNFKLRNQSNLQALNKTLDIGTYLLSGMTTSPTNISGQYKLKSKYKRINTGRPNTSTCPPVGSFFYSVSYSEFYATDIQKISVLGVIFLNYNQYSNYSLNNMSVYDSFEFISAGTPYSYTCAGSNSIYNNLNYISLPFKVEP